MTYTFDENTVSDLFKEVYGFRPYGVYMENWADMTDGEKQAEWNYLLKTSDANDREEKRQDEISIAVFEQRIADIIQMGAADRNTAIRWILEGLELTENDMLYGAGYVCYNLHLPYSMEATIAPALAEFMKKEN